MDSPQPRIVETAHGPIELVDVGEGPAVIVAHGTMGGWDQSVIITRALTEPGFRYLAISRPGYQHTPMTSGVSCEEQADLLAALLDALGINQAAILGISGGGPASLQLAIRHPERVWGLVLVSTCARKAKVPTPPPWFGFMANLMRWSWLRDRIRANMQRNLSSAATMFLSDPAVFDRTAADPEVGPLLKQFFLGTVDNMHLRVKGTWNDIAIMGSAEHALEQIDVETLVVHGTADQMLSYEDHATVFASRIPNAKLLTIDGGEHAAMFTHWDVIRNAIMDYLREHTLLVGG